MGLSFSILHLINRKGVYIHAVKIRSATCVSYIRRFQGCCYFVRIVYAIALAKLFSEVFLTNATNNLWLYFNRNSVPVLRCEREGFLAIFLEPSAVLALSCTIGSKDRYCYSLRVFVIPCEKRSDHSTWVFYRFMLMLVIFIYNFNRIMSSSTALSGIKGFRHPFWIKYLHISVIAVTVSNYSTNTIRCVCSFDRKYFCGTSSSKMSDNKTTLPVLWHSEVFTVENLPFRIIPAFVHFSEKSGEIPSSINTKQVRNILNE